MDIITKKRFLKKILQELQPGILAVSGGVDSSLLALLIKKWGLDFKGVFFSGAHITNFEKKWAKYFLKNIGFEFKEISVHLLNIKEIQRNLRSRCYFCKKTAFSYVKKVFKINSIIEGSHVDDEKKYRPGEKALKELNILSPYKLVGITRKDIEYLINEMGIISLDEFPSRPCLFTRFPYDSFITEDRLLYIGILEDFIFNKGIRDFRVRYLGDNFVIQVKKREKNRFDVIYSEVKKFFNTKGIINFKLEFLEELSGFFDKQKGGD